MSDTQFDDEILDSNAISPTDEEGNPVPVTIPIALAPGVTVVYTTRLGGATPATGPAASDDAPFAEFTI